MPSDNALHFEVWNDEFSSKFAAKREKKREKEKESALCIIPLMKLHLVNCLFREDIAKNDANLFRENCVLC